MREREEREYIMQKIKEEKQEDREHDGRSHFSLSHR